MRERIIRIWDAGKRMRMRGKKMSGGVRALVESYGGEYRTLVRLGLPVVLTQLGVIVVSFADTMMVAAYDTTALAASAFVNSIFVVVTVMQIGFAAGLTPLVGALYSRGDSAGVGGMLKAGLSANAVVSLAFTLLLGILYFFLDHLGQPGEILPMARPAYLLMLGSLLPMAIFNTFQQTSNGCTDTATPMWLIMAGNVFNICGNYALIFGRFGCPELGLTGAALSTLMTRVLVMVAMWAIFANSQSRKRQMSAFGSLRVLGEKGRRLVRRVWNTSYPVMIQSGVECFLWTFGAIVSGWFGTVALASYQVVNTIAQLGFMIYMGFCVATSIRVANLTGLDDIAGVRKVAAAGLHITLALATLSSLAFLLFFEPLVNLFTEDTAVVTAAMSLLVPLILYQYGDATQLLYANAIRGTGDVRPLLWVSLLCYIVVGMPVVYLSAVTLGFGVPGVYYSFSVSLWLAAGLLLAGFYRIIRAAR